MNITGVTGVTEYFDPPENPGPAPNFTEKVGPSHKRHLSFYSNINSNLNTFVIKYIIYTKHSDNSINKS